MRDQAAPCRITSYNVCYTKLLRDRYSGTGGQLARHLLDQLGMTGVKVETTESGDHYDPDEKVVRLTPDKFEGRSLSYNFV